MSLSPGDRIGSYTLVAKLGEGGQGSVWKATDPVRPGLHRALKLVSVAEASEQSIERVRREGRVLAALSHPALVECHEIVEDLKRGVVGLVMDMVEGTPLSKAIPAPSLTLRHREAILFQLVDAMAFFHARNVVHRDLKPDNILLANEFWEHPERPGTVKLVDFGIAASAGNPQPLTQTGRVIGTLPFMPPELIDPSTWQAPRHTPTGDVFAFGVVGWLLLTGVHPTGLAERSTFADYLRAYDHAVNSHSPWPPTSPAGAWGPVLSECLRMQVSRRPADGTAVLRLLRPTADSPRTETAPYEARRSPARPAASTSASQIVPARLTTATRPRWPWVVVPTLGVLAFAGLKAAGGSGVAPIAPWTTALSATTCGQPCCGGKACGSQPEGCASKFTCIPGACTDTLQAGEEWALHLSGLAISTVTGKAIDACRSKRRSAVVCFRRTGSLTPSTCLSVDDACAHDGISTASFPVKSEDLTSSGLEVVVRDPGERGPVIATLSSARYGSSIQRRGLCKGLRFDFRDPAPGDVAWFTYFLRPR